MDTTTRERHVTGLLVARYPDHAPERIERMVDEAFARYDDAAIRAFVPILVQREVERQLRHD